MKLCLYILVFPLFGFSQILFSEAFPFQNISAETTSQKFYDLLLEQELFENIELKTYVAHHKTIAVLPVGFLYLLKEESTTSKSIENIEKLISKCMTDNFITSFNHYSKNMLMLKNVVENIQDKSNDYIPQTEINNYLENEKYSPDFKKSVDLQNFNDTYKKLESIKPSKLFNYSPEEICNILNVDAIIYIAIHSDMFIPVKNCLSLGVLKNIDMFGVKLFSDFLITNEQNIMAKQYYEKLKLKNKYVKTFLSLYDKSGKLIWLYAKKHPSVNIFNTTLVKENNPDFKFINVLLPEVFKYFPYTL